MSSLSIFGIRNGVWLDGQMIYSSIWSTIGMILFGLTLGVYAIFTLHSVGNFIGI